MQDETRRKLAELRAMVVTAEDLLGIMKSSIDSLETAGKQPENLAASFPLKDALRDSGS